MPGSYVSTESAPASALLQGIALALSSPALTLNTFKNHLLSPLLACGVLCLLQIHAH